MSRLNQSNINLVCQAKSWCVADPKGRLCTLALDTKICTEVGKDTRAAWQLSVSDDLGWQWVEKHKTKIILQLVSVSVQGIHREILWLYYLCAFYKIDAVWVIKSRTIEIDDMTLHNCSKEGTASEGHPRGTVMHFTCLVCWLKSWDYWAVISTTTQEANWIF